MWGQQTQRLWPQGVVPGTQIKKLKSTPRRWAAHAKTSATNERNVKHSKKKKKKVKKREQISTDDVQINQTPTYPVQFK
jgi:hypothetical protein